MRERNWPNVNERWIVSRHCVVVSSLFFFFYLDVCVREAKRRRGGGDERIDWCVRGVGCCVMISPLAYRANTKEEKRNFGFKQLAGKGKGNFRRHNGLQALNNLSYHADPPGWCFSAAPVQRQCWVGIRPFSFYFHITRWEEPSHYTTTIRSMPPPDTHTYTHTHTHTWIRWLRNTMREIRLWDACFSFLLLLVTAQHGAAALFFLFGSFFNIFFFS